MATPLLTALVLGATLAWGQTPVGEVRLEAPGAADVGRLQAAFAIQPGSVLSREEIRAGVQALMATGEVEDIEVTVEDAPAGAVIRLDVQVTSRVRSLRIDGLPRRVERELHSLLGVEVGAPLRVNLFLLALARAVDTLQRRGYPDVALDPDLRFDVSSGMLDVRIDGRLGQARALGELRAPGSDLGGAALTAICEVPPGTRLSEGRLEGARRRLEAHLRAGGFWEAEVDSPRLDEAGRLARVILEVRKGPRYRLALTGVGSLRELGPSPLPFVRGEEVFAESALELLATDLRVGLQQEGYLQAQVRLRVESGGDERVLHVEVDRGKRQAIVAVRFPGAESLPEKRLRERVGARTGHPWRWGGEPVDETTLAEDAVSVLGTLQEEGFADAAVDHVRLLGEPGGVAIEFPVREGTRRLVSALEVVGVPEGFSAPASRLRVGEPWSQIREDQDRASLLAALREAGWLDARVESRHGCSDASCQVTLAVAPGVPSVLGRLVVAGLHRTHRSVVDRVAGVQANETLGPQRQLEVQRRLLGLGIFSQADLRPIPGQEEAARRGMVLALTEGPTRAFAFGAGWDTERKVQVSVGWSELNLFGRARSLALEGRYSSRELRLQASYREPAVLSRLGLPLSVSVYRTEERATTYELLRRGLWVELGDRLRRPGRTLLRFEYQVVDPEAPPDVLSSLERDKQQARIASLNPTVEWDTRDDLFAPRRGMLASLQAQWAFRLSDADALFNKLQASAARYVPLAGGVLAGSLRGGLVHPRGPQPPSPAPIDVPISVRFFGGGRVSHRAFATDRLGIAGATLTEAGDPLGGGGLVLANLEWRFPLWGPVGASLFVDGGNVWRRYQDVDLREMRWGSGVGVRVDTPVGPLRVEYGWKHDRKLIAPGLMESSGEIFLAFGNPF